MKPITLLLCVGLFGCAASYHQEPITSYTASTPKIALSSESVVYVTLPTDGAYEVKTYSGSGQMTEQAVATAFAKHGVHVLHGNAVESRQQAVASAQAGGAQYVAMATIVQWEPRATEWSGRPSRMSINMALIDVGTGKTSREEALTARSRIISFTGTSPASLLRSSIGQYVDSLYGSSPVARPGQ